MSSTLPAPRPPDESSIRRLLAALHQALDIPAPGTRLAYRPYLLHLEQRAGIARAAMHRLLSDPRSCADDYASESDHILIQIADLNLRSQSPLGTLVPVPPRLRALVPRRRRQP